ncbi:hypothetical protein ILYODFUR_035403 [Ilyodon furcidens]|uniref:Uncharacterized protein n=1 Tax=Ilyodon furcidens TaxID=33524 RepID=A0ABV0UBG3_9TELE
MNQHVIGLTVCVTWDKLDTEETDNDQSDVWLFLCLTTCVSVCVCIFLPNKLQGKDPETYVLSAHTPSFPRLVFLSRKLALIYGHSVPYSHHADHLLPVLICCCACNIISLRKLSAGCLLSPLSQVFPVLHIS